MNIIMAVIAGFSVSKIEGLTITQIVLLTGIVFIIQMIHDSISREKLIRVIRKELNNSSIKINIDELYKLRGKNNECNEHSNNNK